MGYKDILFTVDKGVATITLNRPEKLNAVSPATLWEVIDAVDKTTKDPKAKVLVIKGAGRAFCSGGDIDADLSHSVAVKSKWRASSDWHLMNILPVQLRYMPQPVIASIQGWAIGFGVTFPVACDFRIASENAKFSVRFVALGNAPEMASTYNLRQVVGLSKALELAITGKTIDAQEALRIGLVNQVVPNDQLETATADFARGIAEGPSVAIELIKRGIYQSLNSDLHGAIQYEAFMAETVRETEDMAEGVKALVEKRKPNFKGR